ncbi:MAPEG family protein [Marinomonas gallaica]|uniref:MAPEG family protein n=1 Tax=Marinomonas gallaica TaxID=1806667 RepID=UPI003A930E23
MELATLYGTAFWGIFVILLTWMVQWFIAAGSKGKKADAVPGKIDESLGHKSFTFRAHRTFMNSLENVPAMLGVIFLAILVGADAFWVMICIWSFAVARILHMLMYYAVATNENPSPRSYFFLMGLLSNIALLVLCAITMINA